MSKFIYEPRGKAKEYCDLAVNLYRGCSHNCKYCYAPDALFMDRAEHQVDRERPGVLRGVMKEAPNYKGREILLCFSTDPYTALDARLKITRSVIEIFHQNEITVRILTKAGPDSERDFDLLSANPELSVYGASLTFIDDDDSRREEPYAAPPSARLAALKKAHKRGIPTWASIEPVVYPEQSLRLIEESCEYVDHFKVGKLNYDPRAEQIDWKDFGNRAIILLEAMGKSYYTKKDLQKHLD